MNRIILCRHGQTAWNTEHRIQGRTDIPLSETGHAQAEALALFLSAQDIPVSTIVSSPMKRAMETARHIADHLGIDIITDDDITEIDTGIYTGRTLEELKTDPGWQKHLADPWKEGYGPCGEPASSVRERIVRAVFRYKNAVFVSHASPIRHAVMHLLDIPAQHLYHVCIGNASATCFEHRDHFVKLRYLNIMPYIFPG